MDWYLDPATEAEEEFDLDAAVERYRLLGAPQDQMALRVLLRQIQMASGGALDREQVRIVAEKLEVKESLLYALIRQSTGLRLAETHCLELCGGPNCSKRAALAAYAEKHLPKDVSLKFVPCMRLCGKGPNLRFDGTLYHQADEALLRELLERRS